MQVAFFPKKVTNKKTTLILGSFETIHNGHLELINVARTFKKPISIMIMANPEDLPGASKVAFTSLKIRLQQLANLEVDFVNVVKFDMNIQTMSGVEFLEKIKEVSNAENVVVGKDFAAGKGRELEAKDIEGATVVELKKVNGKKIGTSLLKELITIGEVDLIKELSPFPYTVETRVSPKSTLDKPTFEIPHPGIYAISIEMNDIRYYGTAHVAMDKEVTIYVPDLNILNTGYDTILSFYKMTRKIFKDTLDTFTNKDKGIAK